MARFSERYGYVEPVDALIRNTITDAIENGHHPTITVVFFIPDAMKAGGSYDEYTGAVKKVDSVGRQIIFFADNGRSSGKSIGIDVISQIHDELIDRMYE